MNFYEDLENAMENLSKRGAFLTVKSKDGVVNTMTISWGYIGFSWNRPHFVTMVRPQRYTHELIENADSYTISIPYNGDMKEALAICGSKSGRDINKEEAADIKYIPSKEVSSPIIDNCSIYYECKIKYMDSLHTENLPEDMLKVFYRGDSHDLYYGEIVKVYKG